MTEPTEHDHEPEDRGRGAHPMTARTWASVVALAVLIVLAIIFVAQNTARVYVKFLGWTWHPALAALLLLALLVGILIALLARIVFAVRSHQRARRARRAHRDQAERSTD